MGTHNLCLEQKYEKYQILFYLKTFKCGKKKFLVVKFSIYLNRRVFVMSSQDDLRRCWSLKSYCRFCHALANLLCLSSPHSQL